MINLDLAKEAFKKYVSNYDMNDKNISLKYYHTLRVSDLCIDIAKYLNLPEEDIKLAGLIGLLHDIGRFEQENTYHSFADSKTVDHAYYSCIQLFENGLIKNYIEDNQYDDIIKKAVFIHNKFQIDDSFNEREQLFSKIIRDADKIDIIYIKSINEYSYPNKEQKISEGILNALKEQKEIKVGEAHTELDNIILILYFVYDMNFKYSFKIIKEKDYINKIIDEIKVNNEQVNDIFISLREKINDFISKNI